MVEEMSRRTHLLLHQEHLLILGVDLLVVDQLGQEEERGVNTSPLGCYDNKQPQIAKTQGRMACLESTFYLLVFVLIFLPFEPEA